MGDIRRDRWDYYPIYKKGKPIRKWKLTPEAIDRLDCFSHYRTLNAPLVAGLRSTSVPVEQKAIKELAAEPHRFLDLYNQRDGTQKWWIGLNAHQWFSLNTEGADRLRRYGKFPTLHAEGKSQEFEHECGLNATVSSIDAGLRQAAKKKQREYEQQQPDLPEEERTYTRMLYATDIIEHPEFLAQDDPSPFSIHVKRDYTFPSKRQDSFDRTFWPDKFFGIEYDNDEHRFAWFEYENRNTIDTSTFKDVSFLMKYLALEYIIGKGLCEARWGIRRRDMVALFASPTQTHIDKMKKIVDRETKGKGCPWIAFQVMPTLTQTLSILPKPELYGAWDRVGYPPLELNQPLEA